MLFGRFVDARISEMGMMFLKTVLIVSRFSAGDSESTLRIRGKKR